MGKFHPGHVTQVNGDVIAIGDDNVFQVLRTPVFTHGTHDIAPLALVEITPAVISVFPFYGIGEFNQRNLAQGQFCRVGDDLDFRFPPAVDIRCRYAFHPLQFGHDVIIDKVIQC